MNQESPGLIDWLSWRPSTKIATATTATTCTDAQAVAPVANVAVAADCRSYLWQIVEDGHSREVMISGCPSFADVRECYPRASIKPLNHLSTPRPKPIWSDERHLRRWLEECGETDSVLIEKLVADFRRWGTNGP